MLSLWLETLLVFPPRSLGGPAKVPPGSVSWHRCQRAWMTENSLHDCVMQLSPLIVGASAIQLHWMCFSEAFARGPDC